MFQYTLRAGLLCAALITISCPVFAAAEDGAADKRLIEEIVVTATYRETALMDTPQSISAVSDQMIEEIGAEDMSQIFRFLPGLNMTGEDTGNTRYAVRGITSQVGNSTRETVASSVAVYMDNAPLTSALGAGRQITGNLFDIERVEVLKGPQGTLFGESSQGGTIRYLFKQADPGGFDAAVDLSSSRISEGDDFSHRIDAMVNVPLIEDRLALRLVAFDTETAGFVDNINPPEEDFNPQRARGGRVSLGYTGDTFDLNLSHYIARQETDGGAAVQQPYEANYLRFPGRPAGSEDDLDITSLTVNWDFEFATFTSITSYTARDTDRVVEQTAGQTALRDTRLSFFAPLLGLPALLGVPNPPLDGGNIQVIIFNNVTETERFAQELRLVSPADQRWRWTAGLYYKDSEDTGLGLAPVAAQPGREQFLPIYEAIIATPANNHTNDFKESAVFGEISVDLTDQWELTAGLRFARLEQTFGPVELGARDQEDDVTSPKVVLSWRPRDDLLTYISYSSGFRPGHVNRTTAINAVQLLENADRLEAAGDSVGAAAARAGADELLAVKFFEGDELFNYEVGAKATLWDGRIQAAAAIYYMDWEDIIQSRQETLGGTLRLFNINEGSAHSKGFEMEVTAQVTDNLRLRFAGDRNSTNLDEGSVDVEGNDLVYAPEYSVSLAANYDWQINDRMVLGFMIDQSWIDGLYTDVQNLSYVPNYHITNAQVTLSDANAGKWRLSLYANNLTNEEILRDRNAETPDANYFHNPRTIGLRFGWKL